MEHPESTAVQYDLRLLVAAGHNVAHCSEGGGLQASPSGAQLVNSDRNLVGVVNVPHK